MQREDPLVTEYRKSFPQKFKTLRDDVDVLFNVKSLEALSKFRLDVHKLAGSLGTYGFLKASQLCKMLDKQLQEMVESFSLEIFNSLFFEQIKLFLKELEEVCKIPDVEISF